MKNLFQNLPADSPLPTLPFSTHHVVPNAELELLLCFAFLQQEKHVCHCIVGAGRGVSFSFSYLNIFGTIFDRVLINVLCAM
jgi:hypothetical protein